MAVFLSVVPGTALDIGHCPEAGPVHEASKIFSAAGQPQSLLVSLCISFRWDDIAPVVPGS